MLRLIVDELAGMGLEGGELFEEIEAEKRAAEKRTGEKRIAAFSFGDEPPDGT